MGDINLDVDVDKRSVERVARALREGIRDGAYESAKWATDTAEDVSQDKIRAERRIWNREVYHGFRKSAHRRPQGAFGALTNPVPHAYIVNYGRKPGSRAPQVQHIIAWVDDKVTGSFSIHAGDDPDDGDAGARFYDHPMVTGEHPVTDVIHSSDSQVIDAPGVNENTLWEIQYGDGSRAIFKANEVQHSVEGVVENEELVGRLWERMEFPLDGDGFPVSRQTSVYWDGGIIDGNAMAFIDNSQPMNRVVRGYRNPDNPVDQDEFLQDNWQTLARIGFTDYILGNDDRHSANARVDANGNVWAIDNGGHAHPSMVKDWLRQKRLRLEDLIKDPNDVDHKGDYLHADYQKADDYMQRLFDHQEDLFRKLQDNRELREDLINEAIRLHGENSFWVDHMEKVLADTGGSSIFAEVDGSPRWLNDLNDIRNEWERFLQDRIDEEFSDPDTTSVSSALNDLESWNSDISVNLSTWETPTEDVIDEIRRELEDFNNS